ncbi:uncharacterized protein [Choristoneura fumiferana]|uniref:uncharacterized protein n=1 Tax=Choristoneura fumiferana TaxID=7141 RepID=UPI003D1540D2
MRGVMAPCRSDLIVAILSLVALSNAGPLGPLPNVTSSDVGLKEGSCVVGDVVYMTGDTFLGTGPCERCACAAGGVTCAPERCQPRPGCKALHRPDHCCPTYQCECEQEGRVYGNGEKLVDPEDPCRVCYCQGGEVVCRRIACFLRDDCQPRHVKGRCCPEYDNCPLRGVTAIPGLVPSVPNISTVEDAAASAVPTSPKENIKQEITIKEITPVSEIPVITDVKIKEILPIPSIEVPDYPSSKSPLIPREAVPEKSVTNSAELPTKTEESVVIEMISPLPTEQASKSTETNPETKSAEDLLPSKISLSTQDSINSEIYPSFVPIVIATMGAPALIPDSISTASTTRVAIIEEDDTSSLFDHNPAFPPIPDDLTIIGNHDDESIHEQNTDSDHITIVHEVENIASTSTPTESSTPPASTSTTVSYTTEIISTTTTKEAIGEISTTTSRTPEDSVESSTAFISTTTIRKEALKDSPMLNPRSAIPTEILNLPSALPEDITGEADDAAESVTAFEDPLDIVTSTTTELPPKIVDETSTTTTTTEKSLEEEILPRSGEISGVSFDTTTQKVAEVPELFTTKAPEELITASVTKSNIATEITSATEFSSLPVETSDQNPHDSAEIKEKNLSTTEVPTSTETTTSKLTTDLAIVKDTTPKPNVITTENQSFENSETTEFSLASLRTTDITADVAEIIKILPTQTERNAALIDSSNGHKTNILTDLINIVGDVASISDHTDAPEVVLRTTTSSSFSADSEELLPVNAGYKSKNSNFNLNSITEIPLKTKNQLPINKSKVVEIEDEDSETIADSPPPNDKVEPTTRRPIIDNVSDSMPKNGTDKKDIEIITQSYVPTINRNRPTKVVMKKSNDKPLVDTSTEGSTPVTEAAVTTESGPTRGADPASEGAPASASHTGTEGAPANASDTGTESTPADDAGATDSTPQPAVQ